MTTTQLCGVAAPPIVTGEPAAPLLVMYVSDHMPSKPVECDRCNLQDFQKEAQPLQNDCQKVGCNAYSHASAFPPVSCHHFWGRISNEEFCLTAVVLVPQATKVCR